MNRRNRDGRARADGRTPPTPAARARIPLVFALLIVVLPEAPAHSDPFITVHLDYKIVLNPVDGSRPGGVTNQDLLDAVRDMNALEESYGRGYRFVLDRITDIGGVGAGPSGWYDIDFFDPPKDSTKMHMELAAETDPGTYGWVERAINVYITNGFCGGISSFPLLGQDIVIIGQCSAANGALQRHELGHYFNLCHTQGCSCGGCDVDDADPCVCGGPSCVPSSSGTCNTEPGNDDVDDTLEDLPCWDLDGIAGWNYGVPYVSLSAANRVQVDVAASNNMSYHDQRPLCYPQVSSTEGQLDRWADASDWWPSRIGVRTGYTLFVSPGGSGSPDGSSRNPFGAVADAVSAAGPAGGDVILLRPGAYNETLVINKRVTLRATREGAATIGAAAPAIKRVPQRVESTLELVMRLKAEDPKRFDTTGTVCGTTWPQ